LWLSTNPGITVRPWRSITRAHRAFQLPERCPTATIRPPRIVTEDATVFRASIVTILPFTSTRSRGRASQSSSSSCATARAGRPNSSAIDTSRLDRYRGLRWVERFGGRALAARKRVNTAANASNGAASLRLARVMVAPLVGATSRGPGTVLVWFFWSDSRQHSRPTERRRDRSRSRPATRQASPGPLDCRALTLGSRVERVYTPVPPTREGHGLHHGSSRSTAKRKRPAMPAV